MNILGYEYSWTLVWDLRGCVSPVNQVFGGKFKLHVTHGVLERGCVGAVCKKKIIFGLFSINAVITNT